MIDLRGIKKIYSNGDIHVAALNGVGLHVGASEFRRDSGTKVMILKNY